MLDSEHPYQKISNVLGIEFEQEPNKEPVEESKQLPVTTNTNVVTTKEPIKASIEDKEYLQFELKNLIQNGVNTLEKLSEDIKIGSSPRTHEVYFNGLGAVRELLKELKELNLDDLNVSKESPKESVVNNTQINFNLTSSNILDMIKKAKETSEMNKIEAKFDIDSSEFKHF